MRVGIPQGFIYYKHPEMWDDFFREFGFDVVLSGRTSRDILETGVKITESESCLPVKVFYGHCQKLLRQKIDILFAPRYISLKRGRLGCPKFFALADVIPYMFEAKVKICAPYINENERSLAETMLELAGKLGVARPLASQAVPRVLSRQRQRQEANWQRAERARCAGRPLVLLVGHPYNLYDYFVNANLVSHLKKLGVTPLMIDWVKVTRARDQDFFFHWDFAAEMLDQVDEAIEQGIAGGLQLSTFNCGCDSVLKEFVEKKFKQVRLSYMPLIIDEHTAIAGIKTRLEAFVDTLQPLRGKR
jgi:predicted nucleotide-binding protein (sugar kinase/HSP70/actin superfamily)